MADLTKTINNVPLVVPPNSLLQLLRAFNIQNVKPLTPSKNDYEGKVTPAIAADEPLYTSAMGTPVYTDIVFRSVTYTDKITNRQVTTREMKFYTVLITINQTKNIVKTEIQGADGTVKEYIGMGDYEVQVNGIITSTNGVYPQDEVIALRTMCQAPVSIPVECRFLNNWGVLNLVIESFYIPEEMGGYSKQKFSLNCISDLPIELQII